jgi:hypothetical protein
MCMDKEVQHIASLLVMENRVLGTFDTLTCSFDSHALLTIMIPSLSKTIRTVKSFLAGFCNQTIYQTRM